MAPRDGGSVFSYEDVGSLSWLLPLPPWKGPPWMRSELVSIVLPTFNRGYCLGAAIDSVRLQSHPDWELIVVDDGSTDGTADLMSRYADDHRIHYIQRSNGGVSAMVAEERTSRGRPTQYGDQLGFLLALDLIDAELSNASISLIPASGVGADLSPLRSELLLAQIDDLPNRVMPRADWAYRVLTGSADSSVRFETLPLETLAIGLLDPSGLPFLHYAIRAPAARLNLRVGEGASYVTFDVSSSLRSGSHVLSSEPASTVEAALDATEARQLAQGTLSYLDRIPAVPR